VLLREGHAAPPRAGSASAPSCGALGSSVRERQRVRGQTAQRCPVAREPERKLVVCRSVRALEYSAAVENSLTGIGAAFGLFVGTNVDDIVVLTVLFLESRASGQPRAWQIWAGQYLGIFALVLFSGLAALGLTIVPDPWVGLLGTVPIVLGVLGLASALGRHTGREEAEARAPAVASGVLSVAALTIANGADNLAVYTPMFRTLDLTQSSITIAVFAVMTALWCLAGSWLGSHKQVIALVERGGPWLVPVLFILIGVLVVIESGVVGRLFAAHRA
jgi:cadmium resistance protein CadD (predicted permease)